MRRPEHLVVALVLIVGAALGAVVGTGGKKAFTTIINRYGYEALHAVQNFAHNVPWWIPRYLKRHIKGAVAGISGLIGLAYSVLTGSYDDVLGKVGTRGFLAKTS